MAATPTGVAVKSVGTSDEIIEVLVDGARFGDMEDVHTALRHGVNVNSADAMGRTGTADWQLSNFL